MERIGVVGGVDGLGTAARVVNVEVACGIKVAERFDSCGCRKS